MRLQKSAEDLVYRKNFTRTELSRVLGVQLFLSLFSVALYSATGQTPATTDSFNPVFKILQRLSYSAGFVVTRTCDSADIWPDLPPDQIRSWNTIDDALRLLQDHGFKTSRLDPRSFISFSGDKSRLLTTRIGHFEIDYTGDIRDQLGNLWATPEVAKQASLSHIVVGPFRDLGIIPLGPEAPFLKMRGEKRVYSDRTILEILSDALVSRQGLIWICRYTRCPDVRRVLFDVVDPGMVK